MARPVTVSPMENPDIPYKIEGLSKELLMKLCAVILAIGNDDELDALFWAINAARPLFEGDPPYELRSGAEVINGLSIKEV